MFAGWLKKKPVKLFENAASGSCEKLLIATLYGEHMGGRRTLSDHTSSL